MPELVIGDFSYEMDWIRRSMGCVDREMAVQQSIGKAVMMGRKLMMGILYADGTSTYAMSALCACVDGYVLFVVFM